MRRIALTALALAAAAPCQMFFPPPPTPTANTMTMEKALLGMALFWEEQLSANNQVACGTCHQFSTGGADTRSGVNPGHDGVFGTADDVQGSPGVPRRDASGRLVASEYGLDAQVTSRKAPSMINVAYQDRLFYDGRAADGDYRDPITNQVVASGPVALENLILEPPLNPVEMGQDGRTWQDVADKIAASQPLALADQIPQRLQNFLGTYTYPQLFQQAYGTADVTPTRIVFAIATYIRTLVADQSDFDFVLAGSGTLTPREALGRQVFEQTGNSTTPGQPGAASCVRCHGDVSTTSHQSGPSAVATTPYGSTPTGNFHNVGIRPIVEDPGAGGISGQPHEMGRFKVPMLRNVALHGEFGHNGQFTTLAEVVDFYDRGGDFHVNQAPEIQARNFTQAEMDGLVAFMDTLTDPRVAAGVPPFDSPVLGSQSGAQTPAPIGAPSVGTGGAAPKMVANDPWFLGGEQIALGVADVRPNSPTALLWSLTSEPNGVNLFGPTLYVGLAEAQLVGVGYSQTAPSGTGYASAVFDIPNDPLLGDVEVYTQWLVLDPQAIGGVAASEAVGITLN